MGMDTELKKVVVSGVLVRNGDKILLLRKADGAGPYGGTYLTPGGGVETGESIDDAATRELYEETGVKVKNLKRAYFDDDVTENWQGIKKHYIMLLYTADYESGDLKPTEGNDDKFDDVGWFSKADLNSIKMSPPLKMLLKAEGYIR
jgi:ADP-ribose pyrophosphatase YjhB (NUDIX family)